MKKTFLTLILWIVFLPGIHAQEYNSEFLQAKVRKFSRMENTGIVLSAAGGISLVGGIALMSRADWTKNYNGTGDVNYSSNDPNALIGILFTGAGVGLLGAGIPLAIIGHRKSKTYKKRLDNLTLVPYYDINHTGIYFSLRF